VERPVQVYLPPKIYHDALGFILEQLTPVAHEERAEIPHDKQDELHHRLLRCEIRAQGPSDVVMLNEIECDISTPSGENWVGRNVYKWFPGNEEVDIKTTCSGTVTTYSKLGTITPQGYQSDVFHIVFANADKCDIDEESLRRLPVYCHRQEAIPRPGNRVPCGANRMCIRLWQGLYPEQGGDYLGCGGQVQQGSCTSASGNPRQLGGGTILWECRQEYPATHMCLWQDFCIFVCAEEPRSGKLGWIIS